ncbi:hypothetical protein AGMMS49938_13570 [Fibrobacterales bacterium]|nr:hypothetical protein AGMMS49938_13570 [Fibrobacterales bacterium]
MRLSILHLIIAGIIFVVFLIAAGAEYNQKNTKISELNEKVATVRVKLNEINDIGDKTLLYIRICKGLDVLTKKNLSAKQKEKLAKNLFKISRDYQIDPILILSVVKVESRGNPQARGAFLSGEESGALGLMQIKFESALEVARSVGVRLNSPEDLFNPETNLMVGTAYLLRLIAKYQNLQYALTAYNIGFGDLDNRLKKGSALPTKYYKSIMTAYSEITNGMF